MLHAHQTSHKARLTGGTLCLCMNITWYYDWLAWPRLPWECSAPTHGGLQRELEIRYEAFLGQAGGWLFQFNTLPQIQWLK